MKHIGSKYGISKTRQCKTVKEYRMNDALLKNKEVAVALITGIERTLDDSRTLGIVEKYINSNTPVEVTHIIHSISDNDPFL
jgi:hypothetical protein